MDDHEQRAIAALRRGDVAGLEALVRLHQLRAIRAAYAIIGHRQLAEDAAADAFLQVYDRISQYDERRPFAPWFYRIVVNNALKAARRASRDACDPTAEDEDWLEQQTATTAGPEDELLARELRLLLLAAIYALPPQQRAAVVLRYYLDMDEQSIAQTLGCPLGTVKWRLHAARERLRRDLLPKLEPDTP